MKKHRLVRRALMAGAIAIATLASQLPSSVQAASPPVVAPLPSGMAGVHGEVSRLYLALLDREPEKGGLDYWVSERRSGASLRALVAFFRSSPEFEERFGSMIDASTAEWVEFIYQQVLGRASDAPGKRFWIELIESGSASKEDLIIHFSESPEFQVSTGTGMAGFLHLVEESQTRYASEGDSYIYSADSSSYWGRATTTFTVVDGIIVERSYEGDWGWDGVIDDAWTETGDDIGSHTDQGEAAATIPEVHSACQELLRTLDPIAHELSLGLDNEGRMAFCGGVHLQIADAVNPMVEIDDFEPLD